MSYIEKTLSENEKIISSSKFHWWFLVKEIFYFILIIISALYFSNLSSKSMDNAGLFSSLSYFLFLLSILPGIRLLYGWIVRLTTEQVLTNKRVFIKRGVIRRDTDELTREKVETISIRQTILGRVLNFGEIEFTGTGGVKLKFTFVANPAEVKKNYE